jgi:hypothetical protein
LLPEDLFIKCRFESAHRAPHITEEERGRQHPALNCCFRWQAKTKFSLLESKNL